MCNFMCIDGPWYIKYLAPYINMEATLHLLFLLRIKLSSAMNGASQHSENGIHNRYVITVIPKMIAH